MPKAQAQSETIEYIGKVNPIALLAFVRSGERFASKTPWHYKGERGANLRQILLQNGVDLYNNGAKVVDCRRIDSCAPYAVLVEGEVSIAKSAQKARQSVPPYSSASKDAFRLSNQGIGQCET